MSTPFMAEMRIMSFGYAPKGWAQCNGQFMPINQNQALFSLLGTTYGGNGQTTFQLPDFRGRMPIHVGSGFTLGQRGGEEAHTVTHQEMPQHLHFLMGTSANATTSAAAGAVLATSSNAYRPPDGNLTTLQPDTVTAVGGSQPHTNVQPFLTLNFCIALQGLFPSRD